MQRKSAPAPRTWPDYAAVWRWHFYAGLFCLPFVVWLSVTGVIYLFRPDIESWLDRRYESLALDTPRALPSAEVHAALAALPGSVFNRYEPPATATGAAQIVLSRDAQLFRVYVHPGTLRIMSLARDDHRSMELLAQLHGNFLLGPRGSMLVELAACWAIVLILTGLYLWLPRGRPKAGGLLYPRIGQQGRLFWRDLHAVAGFWASIVTLFILFSGLPWSSNWGNYLTWARNLWTVTAGQPDWPVGGAPTGAPLPTDDAGPAATMAGMHHAETTALPAAPGPGQPDASTQGLDKIVPIARTMDLPRPVWIQPPLAGSKDWRVGSQTQNRPRRVDYLVNPDTGEAIMVRNVAGENIVDRVVNFAIAAHEGQLFGRPNQAILLLDVSCLLMMSLSATIMWWRRRPPRMLGAPAPAARPRFSMGIALTVAVLAVLLPLFGLSLLLILAADRILLRQLPAARRWLGLAAPTT